MSNKCKKCGERLIGRPILIHKISADGKDVKVERYHEDCLPPRAPGDELGREGGEK